MFRDLRSLRGRLCPIHPENVSAPYAKFELVPLKIQQTKILIEILSKVHVPPIMKGFAYRSVCTSAITISVQLMAHLFDPLKLRGVEFAHCIVVSPMCQYSCKDGFATVWHFVHLGSRAVGRAAAVIAEATAVTADSRISPQDLGLWTDAHIEPLRRAFSFVAQQGSVPGIQLAHAGRKASTNEPWNGGKPISPAEGGWTPIFAPSALAFAEG